MRRILAFFLIFTALASIFTLSVNAIDRDFGTDLYTIPYTIEVVAGAYTISDGDIGVQNYPSVFMNTENSQVSALYSGSLLTLRKSSTLQTSTIDFNTDNKLTGTARIYNVFTNFASGSEYEVTITLRNVPYVLGETMFSIGFNGDIVGDLSYASVVVPTEHIQNYGDYTDVWYTYDSTAVIPNIDGNIFNSALWDICEERFPDTFRVTPDCYILPEIIINYVVSNATGNLSYSLNRYYTEQYEVIVGNNSRYAYPFNAPYGATVDNIYDVVKVDTNIVDWLGDCVDSVFSIEIFDGITLSNIIWACLGVGLVIMFIKFFAGG